MLEQRTSELQVAPAAREGAGCVSLKIGIWCEMFASGSAVQKEQHAGRFGTRQGTRRMRRFLKENSCRQNLQTKHDGGMCGYGSHLGPQWLDELLPKHEPIMVSVYPCIFVYLYCIRCIPINKVGTPISPLVIPSVAGYIRLWLATLFMIARCLPCYCLPTCRSS